MPHIHPTRLVFDVAHPFDSVLTSNHACCSCVENECSHICFGIVSKMMKQVLGPRGAPPKNGMLGVQLRV